MQKNLGNSTVKPFDPEVYSQCDPLAKKAVRSYLDRSGAFTLIDEDYGADIRSLRSELHEVEIKKGWTDPAWPTWWPTCNIPYRKKKYFKTHTVIFWLLSADCTQAMVVNSRTLNDTMVEEVPNKEVSRGELFYRVPLDKCYIVKMEKNDG